MLYFVDLASIVFVIEVDIFDQIFFVGSHIRSSEFPPPSLWVSACVYVSASVPIPLLKNLFEFIQKIGDDDEYVCNHLGTNYNIICRRPKIPKAFLCPDLPRINSLVPHTHTDRISWRILDVRAIFS